jgi:DNA-binding NarL/FixJ family response regulator
MPATRSRRWAAAESEGRQRARGGLRGELLRKIKQTAKRVQEATGEHQDEIRRAAGVGLSTREIAVAAEISRGTVRAIINRTDAPPTAGDRRQSVC